MPLKTATLGSPVDSVTFLFTDIEDSTRLWDIEPERMAAALERHDQLCHTAVASHGGRLVKMTGDGLYAVFHEPTAAVATALALQQGIGMIAGDCGLSLRMRSGLHAGVSLARNGDYFGTTVNRAARIMSAAHGGQILLSQAVVDQGKGRLGEDVDLLPLGRVRLRGLSDPEEVWQLLHHDLPCSFPPLRSLDVTPNNLPQQLTSFIGREEDIAEIKTLLTSTRLITLIGAGGCGKTRLSLKVATDLLQSFTDGVWLVELATLTDARLVPRTFASIFGLQESQDTPLMQTIVDHLRSRHVLLLLDNCEHMIEACATLADTLLRNCPGVAILSSSRQRLGIDGERPYRVPSLSTPDPSRDRTRESLSQFESVRLFTERAQCHQPRFVVTEENAPAVASICNRLDGIPLAIELAAARMRSLSAKDIAAHLNQRFRLLSAGSTTAPARQQTLRALIDWSYGLLTEAEQTLFQGLSVFAGGWTLDAAERVCGHDCRDPFELLELLTSLVDKNLVVTDAETGGTRYAMPETIRHYALDRLSESGKEAQVVAGHLAYFISLAEKAERVKLTAAQRDPVSKLNVERDNLRAALSRAAAPGDVAGGLRLASSLAWFWRDHHIDREGLASFSTLLALSPNDPDNAARARALSEAAFLAANQRDYATATAMQEECLAISKALGDRSLVARSLNGLGAIASGQGDHRTAQTLFDEALSIRRELGDLADIQNSLLWMGYAALGRGDFLAARHTFDESLAMSPNRGAWQAAEALGNMASAAYFQGDAAAARKYAEESVAISRELDLKQFIIGGLGTLGVLAHDEGDDASGCRLLRQALTMDLEMGNAGSPAMLEALGGVAVALGMPDVAVCIFGGAERLREELGTPLSPEERPWYDRHVAAARGAFDDDGFRRAWHGGRAVPQEDLVQYALNF